MPFNPQSFVISCHDLGQHLGCSATAWRAYTRPTSGYQCGEPCDPGPDWSAWNAAQLAPHRTVRPEAAVAGVVTAHARLLAAFEGLDDAGRRRGPTRFDFETSGWDLLVAEAAHEREHAARLVAHIRQPALALDAPCRPPSPVLRTS